MNFRITVLAAGLLMVSAGVSDALELGSGKPGIAVIVADDLGYADTGFNGGVDVVTPHLDRFAESGVRLTDFRACPMCSPTRAGLMTGRWPLRFGMMRAVVPPWSTYGIPQEELTLPEALADAGYARRGIFGKWHLGHTTRTQLPPQNGFTHFIGHYNGAIDYFTHEREGEPDWHNGNDPLHEPGYSTDLIAAHAAEFVRESPEGKPWFLYVPFNAPHSPYQALEKDLAVHAGKRDIKRRTHAAMVTAMDRGIGHILEAIESRADAENTLILFFSDNGGILSAGSNGPWRGAKLTVYEGGTRVAAAIRWKAAGIHGGGSFDGRIGYIDVMPSILSAAGIPLPAQVQFDGVSFLSTLTGRESLPRRPWFTYMHQSAEASSSVHLGDWKLVVHGDVFPPTRNASPEKPDLKLELYNLTTDPGEKSDVADHNPDRVAHLKSLLRDFGKLQRPGVRQYGVGRNGFSPPENWNITH